MNARAGEKGNGYFIRPFRKPDLLQIETAIPRMNLDPLDLEMIIGEAFALAIKIIAQDIRRRIPDGQEGHE